MWTLLQDLRYAIRQLRRSPGFSTTAVLTLALGIGATTALFSVVNGVLLRPLPYPEARGLVIVFENDRISGTEQENASVPDFYDFREQNRVFERLAAFQGRPMTLSRTGGEPERLNAGLVSRDFFSVLKVAPILGRTFSQAEDSPGGEPVALLSDALWRSRFGGDPTILGHQLRLDDRLYTVVGVLSARIDLPAENTDLWVPLQLGPSTTPRSVHNVAVVARLGPGVSLEAARADMSAVASQLEAAYPDFNRGRGVSVEPLSRVLFGDVQATLLVLLAAVALVLLIACANVASLLLARGLARRREVAVRTALGATTGRLMRQFLVESIVLTLLAAGAGILLALWGLDLLLRLAPTDIPRLAGIGVDARVLGVLLAVLTTVGVLFGLIPAIQARRVDVRGSLQRDAGRSGTGSMERRKLRDLLVVSEVAVSIVLAIGAGLLIESLWKLQRVDPGFQPENILKVELQLPASRYPQSFDRYPNWTEISHFYSALLGRVATLSGVRGSAIAINHPLSPGFTSSFVIEGRERESRELPEVPVRAVSPGYFGTVGIPLLRGRMLTERDRADGPAVLLINEAAARRFFPNDDPVGRRISLWDKKREIVGIVGNERFNGLGEDAPPAVYPPLQQGLMSAASLLIRASGNTRRLLPAVREAVWSLDPELALFKIETLDQTLSQSISRPRFTTFLLGIFAGLALLLTVVGVHGLLSFSVAQRTQEIGIRMALGAHDHDVLRSVVGRALALTIMGSVAGLAGAFALTRLLSTLLFGVSATDLRIFTGVPLLLALLGLLASYLPARRALRVDPMLALRSE